MRSTTSNALRRYVWSGIWNSLPAWMVGMGVLLVPLGEVDEVGVRVCVVESTRDVRRLLVPDVDGVDEVVACDPRVDETPNVFVEAVDEKVMLPDGDANIFMRTTNWFTPPLACRGTSPAPLGS